MDIFHEPHLICGKAGDRDLTLEYLCRQDFVNRPKPVVGIIPGGGWLHGGMKSVANPVDVLPYLDAGLMVVCLRYRPVTEAPFPACRDDIRTALDWLRTNTSRLKIMADQMALDGGSAGGHLAALTAALETERQPADSIRAVIIRGAPSDLAKWFTEIHDNELLNGCVRKLLGGTPQEKPEICREASPATHVGPGMPPFLIFHGEKDTAVPLSQTELLERRLRESGVSVERIIVRNGAHGLNPNDETGSSPTLVEIFAMKVAFLRRHLRGMV